MKILIVEDDKILRNILEQKLTDEGMEVITASNGNIALEKLNQTTVDLALVDILMPEMDGVTLIQNMQSQMDTIPPIIIITNYENPAIPTGVSKVLIKSEYSLNQIISEIKSVTNKL